MEPVGPFCASHEKRVSFALCMKFQNKSCIESPKEWDHGYSSASGRLKSNLSENQNRFVVSGA